MGSERGVGLAGCADRLETRQEVEGGAHRGSIALLEAWLRDDVSEHADAMLQRREQGSRPCDGAWPAEPVDRFRSWMDAGKPE